MPRWLLEAYSMGRCLNTALLITAIMETALVHKRDDLPLKTELMERQLVC